MDMYVAGKWQSGSIVTQVMHPFTGEVIAEAPVADQAQIEAALEAAGEGARTMRAISAYERHQILLRTARLIDVGVEELAHTISLESGKPLAEARAEAGRVGDVFRLSASEGARMHGETIPVDAAPGNEDKLAFTVRQPCGVVLAITPFNYPLLLAAHKVAPALAAGNAVILKPAEETPSSALELTRLLLEAGLPGLALQCVMGPGEVVGEALCADPRVRQISFTGSSAVGERITRIAGVKKMSLELGSNAAMVVLADADPEVAAQATVTGGYANAGQVCLSVQRVIVSAARYADYLDALRPRVEQLQVGDPFLEGTQVSSLISETAALRVESVISAAVASGAKLLTGAGRDGALVRPAIVTDVDPQTDLMTKELFGPAVAVMQATTVDEAVRLVDNSVYGLAAGIFTENITHALSFARAVAVGNVQINSTPQWRADLMPYGGLKGSGFGKEGPRYAVEEMTELKTVAIHGLS